MLKSTAILAIIAALAVPVAADAKDNNGKTYKKQYKNELKQAKADAKAHEKAHKKAHKTRATQERKIERFRLDDDTHLRKTAPILAQQTRNCPPGLAKKTPACIPPGLAKKAATNHDDNDGHRYWHRHDNEERHEHRVRYRIGDRIDGTYVEIEDPEWYDLDPRHTYYNQDGYIFRVDRETREVLGLIGAIDALVN